MNFFFQRGKGFEVFLSLEWLVRFPSPDCGQCQLHMAGKILLGKSATQAKESKNSTPSAVMLEGDITQEPDRPPVLIDRAKRQVTGEIVVL